MLKQRAFWISFFATLALMCPLFLGALAYVNVAQARDRAQLAESPQSGIQVVQPTTKDQKTVLVMTGTGSAQTPSSFALVYFNALENRISVLALPGETLVRAPGGAVTLASAVADAGPAQGVSALADTLAVRVDHYLFTTPTALWQAMESFGTIPLRLGEHFSKETLQTLQVAIEGVETQQITPRVLAQVLAHPAVDVQTATALRAQGYGEYLRVGAGRLSTTLPNFVRASSAKIATNLTANDLFDYERTLRFLDKQEPTCRGVAAPGAYVLRADGTEIFELDAAVTSVMQEHFPQNKTFEDLLPVEDATPPPSSIREEATPEAMLS